MKKLFTILAVLIVPLTLMAAMYDFDTGAQNTKVTTSLSSATGDARTVAYLPDVDGFLVDEKVTQVWGWASFATDTGFYKVDTVRMWFESYVEDQWVSLGDTMEVDSVAVIHTGRTYGLDEVCTIYPLRAHRSTFSDRYRWAITLSHDSVATATYFNYRLYGLDYDYNEVDTALSE